MIFSNVVDIILAITLSLSIVVGEFAAAVVVVGLLILH
jgi:hypothetical protein